MSTSAQIFTDHFDHAPANGTAIHNIASTSELSGPTAKRKRQTPYKPRLSTLVRRAMEESVDDSRELQYQMDLALDWLEAERNRRESLRQRISCLSPLDHRMADLVEEEREPLITIGKMDHIMARMALTVARIDRRHSETLQHSRDEAAGTDKRTHRRAKGPTPRAPRQ